VIGEGSLWRPYFGFQSGKSKNLKLDFLQEKVFIESINAAKEKPVPNNFVALNDAEQNAQSKYFPKQEKGLKPSNPLPYHFEVNFSSKGIDMQNHTEKATPVMVYNRKKLNEDKDFYSRIRCLKSKVSIMLYLLKMAILGSFRTKWFLPEF
jgi:hypothetical protein